MEDYFSDEEILTLSDSDSIDLNKNEITSDYTVRNQNRQIETLKQLRHCLNENKVLKQRLVIVEAELENYLEYKNFLPLVAHKDQCTLTEPVQKTPVQVEEKVFILTETKECQADFEHPVLKPPTPPPPLIILKEKTQVHVLRQDNQTQCDEDFWKDKEMIKNLEEEIETIKQERETERHKNKTKIDELTLKSDELNRRLEDTQKTIDTTNDKLSEYLKANIKLSSEVEEFREYKEKHDLLVVENEELSRNLSSRQKTIEDTTNQVLELTKKLNECLELNETQKQMIVEIEKKNKDSLEKFMDECLRLKKENYELKQNKEGLENELKNLAENLIMLQKEIDRYKSDLKNFNFKEFVSVKRELKELKEERERYFANIVTMPQSNQVLTPNQQSSPLPPIKPIKKNVFNFFN